MARTVDTSSTLENFRQEHNNLANDVGAIGNWFVLYIHYS